jgi:hypothetical protein
MVDCRTVGATGLPIRTDGRCEVQSAGARYILVVEVFKLECGATS